MFFCEFAHIVPIIKNLVPLYSYAMDGLSADKMKVLLHPHEKKREKEEDNDDNKLLINNNRLESNHHPSTEFPSFGDSIVLSTMQDGTRGKWKRAQVRFAFL